MALGGVATGNIKAQLPPSAITSVSSDGGKFKAVLSEANIGISRLALAVLLVNSVSIITKIAKTPMIKIRLNMLK